LGWVRATAFPPALSAYLLLPPCTLFMDSWFCSRMVHSVWSALVDGNLTTPFCCARRRRLCLHYCVAAAAVKPLWVVSMGFIISTSLTVLFCAYAGSCALWFAHAAFRRVRSLGLALFARALVANSRSCVPFSHCAFAVWFVVARVGTPGRHLFLRISPNIFLCCVIPPCTPGSRRTLPRISPNVYAVATFLVLPRIFFLPFRVTVSCVLRCCATLLYATFPTGWFYLL